MQERYGSSIRGWKWIGLNQNTPLRGRRSGKEGIEAVQEGDAAYIRAWELTGPKKRQCVRRKRSTTRGLRAVYGERNGPCREETWLARRRED